MSLLIDQINAEIEKHSLLKHRFYQLWQEGKLTLDHLAGYSKEYYQLVKTVPEMVQYTLNNNPDPHSDNLIKTTLREENEHIELWKRFASSLNVSAEDLNNYSPDSLTTKAIDSLLKLCTSSFIEGVAAMYAFEKELPKISETKSHGLRKFYGLHEVAAHEYFDTHKEVDVYHAKIWENILNNCPEDLHEKALHAAKSSLKAQNELLDAVQKRYVNGNLIHNEQ